MTRTPRPTILIVKITTIVVVALALSVLLVTQPSQTQAQFSGGEEQNWGGPFIFALPCLCEMSYAWLFVIGDPAVTGMFEYEMQTQEHNNKTLPYAIAGLGKYSGESGMCYMGVEPYCYQMPSQGTIVENSGSS